MQGGEIFVPKIPSTKITDLADVVAPGLPHKIVGIRPGEKLHEVMITEDDARVTLELNDRYLIRPWFSFWDGVPYTVVGAKSVSDGFRYSSDTNPLWLDNGEIARMLQLAKV